MRWNIAAEDSGGDALADTPAGIFARLAAAAALDGTPPVTLLALLKHPLLRLGEHRAVATLERAILRGPRPRAGSAGLARALANFREQLGKYRRKEPVDLHHSDPRTDLTDSELAAATDLVTRLGEALAPLESLGRKAHPLSELAGRHREVLAALSRHGGDAIALTGRDGQKLADALDELATSDAAAGLGVETSDYVELFSAALAGRVVRREPQAGLRVRILGPLEARSDRKRSRCARRPRRGHLAAGQQ